MFWYIYVVIFVVFIKEIKIGVRKRIGSVWNVKIECMRDFFVFKYFGNEGLKCYIFSVCV